MTNYDRFKSLTIEELAAWFVQFEMKCYLRVVPSIKLDTENYTAQYIEWLKEEEPNEL